MNIKVRIKPKTKRRRNIAKNRIKKYTKQLLKRSNRSKITPKDQFKYWSITTLDDDQEGIIAGEHGRRTYPEHHEVDQSYLHILEGFTWEGMITIKFHHWAYTSNDRLGFARDRRFDFGNQVMENLCNRWFGVKKTQMVWAITDEFGLSGDGHIHIVFSFDNLNSKGLERVSKIDFLNDEGEFYEMLQDSCDFIRRIINSDSDTVIGRNQIDCNWKAQWDNEGLCRYMTKLEDCKRDKEFHLHNIIPAESEQLVTK